MPDRDNSDFDRLLGEARRKLDDLRAGVARPEEGAAPARGTGEASEGRVRATAAGGRLESLEFEPRVMRLSGEELSGHTLTAVNAALDDLRAQAPAASEVPVDLAALKEQLREIQDEGLRTMSMITRGLNDVMAQVQARTGMRGDPGSQGLEHLLGQLQRDLDAVQPPGDLEELRGEGEAADGLIRSAAEPGGRVVALEIAPRAMRLPSGELAEHIRTAVNEALADLEAKALQRTGFAAIDPRRLQALQDMSLQHMTNYTRSLSDLMSSIQEP